MKIKKLPNSYETPEDEKLYLECECMSKDHVAVFSLQECPWTSSKVNYTTVDLYLDVQMRRQQLFWKRVWTALRYVFKSTPCEFGYWNNIIISPTNAQKIIEFCKDFLKRNERCSNLR